MSSKGKIFVNVSSRRFMVRDESGDFKKRFRREGMEGSVGVARTCWTFLQPASWVKMEGHFMAFDRSIWRRAVHAVGDS